jgi:hypothetical protein
MGAVICPSDRVSAHQVAEIRIGTDTALAA